MFEEALTWFKYWLPLIQGFAALASIGGALLSWKYALKAQRAREEMTKNVVSSRLVSSFEHVLEKLQDFRSSSIGSDGKPDYAAYQRHEQTLKDLLERALAQATAASPYFKVPPKGWQEAVSRVADASVKPDPGRVEYACKQLRIVTEGLKAAASTRELAANE